MCKLRRKKNIRRNADIISVYNLDGSLKDAISLLNDYIEKYGDSCQLDVVINNCCYDCNVDIEFYYYSDESDEEYNLRCKQYQRERNAKKKKIAKQEEKEKNEYERLKKKFEGK